MAERPAHEAVAPPRRARRILDLIALFKFLKAATLVASAAGALDLLSPGVQDRVSDFLEHLALVHAYQFIGRVAERALALLGSAEPHRLVLIAIGALLYATLFLVEGIGLIRARRWAEYLTVVATASLLPFEIVALVHRVTVPRILTLVANVAVVLYLIWRLYDDRRNVPHHIVESA